MMSSFKLFLLACLLLFPGVVFSQKKPEQKPEPSSEAQDVIKFDTSLVQTDVMVFDKKGHFVDNLKPEQFQLKINNTPREISFFDRIMAGSSTTPTEERDSSQPHPNPNPVDRAKADAQRRSVIFFVDDLHLAPDSMVRTRKALLDFI